MTFAAPFSTTTASSASAATNALFIYFNVLVEVIVNDFDQLRFNFGGKLQVIVIITAWGTIGTGAAWRTFIG